jgi:hypothetical protein
MKEKMLKFEIAARAICRQTAIGMYGISSKAEKNCDKYVEANWKNILLRIDNNGKTK